MEFSELMKTFGNGSVPLQNPTVSAPPKPRPQPKYPKPEKKYDSSQQQACREKDTDEKVMRLWVQHLAGVQSFCATIN